MTRHEEIGNCIRCGRKDRLPGLEFCADCEDYMYSKLIEDKDALQTELTRLTAEVTRLAIESIEREKQLAKLEAEVQHWAEAEASGRMVVLPIWGSVYIKSNGQVQEMKVVHYSGNGMGVYAMSCECVDQYEDCDAICSNENEKACAYQFRVAEIGKTVFSTREAALEAAGKE